MPEDAMPRRVLVVAASFPPDAAVGTLRTLRLLRHLASNGWAIDVLTIAPETYRAGTVTDAASVGRVPATVRVIPARALRPAERIAALLRGKRTAPERVQAGAAVPNGSPEGPARPIRQWLRRAKQAGSAVLMLPDREVSWLVPAVLKGAGAVRRARPDVIYSSGPPFTAHMVAAVLSAVLRRPWVADFRDPWARAPWRDDRFAFEKRAWSIFERLVVARANTAVFVTRTNERDFARQYGERIARRFRVVPNGCDVADFDGLQRRDQRERFVLLHAGSLYGARTPAPLFRAVASAIARGTIDPRRFRIRLIGRIGIAGLDAPAMVRELGLSDVVELVPHMPRRAVLQEMLDASALLIVQPVTTVSVPGKLYEYLATGRPVLGLTEIAGETAAIIRSSPGGVAVPANDEAAIEKGLIELMAARSQPLSPPARELYDGTARAVELEKILIHAAAARRSTPAGVPHVELAVKDPAGESRRS